MLKNIKIYKKSKYVILKYIKSHKTFVLNFIFYQQYLLRNIKFDLSSLFDLLKKRFTFLMCEKVFIITELCILL